MLIFLDVETTGLESEDRICSLATVCEETFMYELVNEGKKITAEASAIHHITKEDILDAPCFQETEIYAFLKQNNRTETTLVAHNIPFVLEKLRGGGLSWLGGVVDTNRVSKHLMQECESFSLNVLKYELRLYKKEEAFVQKYGIKDALCTTKALHDVFVVQALYNLLLEMKSLDVMQELSFKEVLLEKFSFGKYKGSYIEEICMNDRAYIEWLLLNAKDIDEDTKYSLNYYLEG